MPVMARLARYGGPLPAPARAYRVDITREPGAAAFTLYRGREPIVLNICCWVAPAEAASWSGIERTYFTLAEQFGDIMVPQAAPDMPSTRPWLATLILPFLALQVRDDISWMGDWERCMAWTLMALDAGTRRDG